MIINLFGPEQSRFIHYFKRCCRTIISSRLEKMHLKLQKYFGFHIILTQLHKDAKRIYCCSEKFFNHTYHDYDYIITYHNETNKNVRYILRENNTKITKYEYYNIVRLFRDVEKIKIWKVRYAE